MNIRSLYSDYKVAGAALLGVVVVGYLGYRLIKWLFTKPESVKRVDNLAKAIIQDKPEPKPVPVKDLSTSAFPKTLEPCRVDLIDSDYPKGVTQYTYPIRRPGENIPQACSFLSATFIQHTSKHLAALTKALHNKDTKTLIEVRKQIIDEGLATRNQALAKGMEDNAIHPEQLSQFVEKFEELQLNKGHVAVITGIMGNINEELAKLFNKTDETKNTFSLIEADGQTFALFGINSEQAFLFDSHKSWFAVVSKEGAKQYIENEILHLEHNPEQSVDFYHGSI